MALIRWEPFREIESMQRQMNRLFDQMTTYNGGLGNDGDRIDNMTLMPATEIHETPNEVKLKVEVPGVEANDLDVKVSAEAVAIQGERKTEIEHEDKSMRRSEFRYGSFARVIPLPARIQNDKVQAEFKNGVLCLTLPKAEEEKNRVVTVSLQGQSQQGQIPQAQPSQSQNQSSQEQPSQSQNQNQMVNN